MERDHVGGGDQFFEGDEVGGEGGGDGDGKRMAVVVDYLYVEGFCATSCDR